MAQGLDLKTWDNDKSPSTTDSNKVNEGVKRTRVMGSRRIFPPQFKLQVLDSYRNDLDCRGNQRATARKYNIHRRQIQKWLQCEQNLRTCVEESINNEGESLFRGKKCEIVKNGDSKMDSALNRSAMIYTRLNDAERTREENAVRPTLKQETKVYDMQQDAAAVKLEAQNLKRVAQKLYPSSQAITIEKGENIMHRTVHISGQKFDGSEVLDDNFNKILPEGKEVEDDGPLDLINKARTGQPVEGMPKECLLNDTRNEIFTVQIENKRMKTCCDKLTMDESNVGRQKLSDAIAVPKCLVQKYTNDSEGQKFNAFDGVRNELLCSRDVDVESSCLLDIQVPVSSTVSLDDVPASSTISTTTVPDVSLDNNVPTDNRAKLKTKLTDDAKSFSPKRKWMQESLQEQSEPLTENARSKSYPVLPIKQRVKMNLRSVPGSPVVEDEPPPRKGVSPNFTIERLCASDIKTETTTPTPFQEQDCYPGWRSENCGYVPLHQANQMQFPPPLILPHRVIPDLVSLHFKPEGFDSKNEESYDIPMKEEKMSDSEENMDIDVLNTTPVEKKTFDFSNYNMGKRRSFSVQFKLTVLDAFYNDKDCNKNQRATARKFNINRRQVQKWLSQESDLRSEGSIKNGKYLQRQRLGTDRDLDVGETCMQCPQHCLRKKREELGKSIEFDVKHCSDNQCLSGDKPHSDNAKNYDYYGKNCFQSDLKSANIYDNYLIPENNNMIYHDSYIGWPNLNASALQVPNYSYMSPWYRNFEFCHEKSKIY